jgi:non-specific protein-tyrosine kinase
MPSAGQLESYKMLRTQLIQRTRPLGWNTIMITSACPGEGKTLTAINLALIFAKTYNQTVLLLDCDLRRQSIYHYLGLSDTLGLVDHLLDGVPLNELIVWPEVDQLTLISGGRTIADSAELLASPRMRALLAEMKSRYADRYILLDSPPILSGADTLTLAELVDGIVVVVESGKTDMKVLADALALIPKEKIVGFLLNKHASPVSDYYGYYYLAAGQRAGNSA